jgi:hypothetical protein
MPQIKRLILTVMLGGLLTCIAGCEQVLFPEGLPRTQYERFDRMRGVYRPKETVGPTGNVQPDLRSRLDIYQ